MSRETNSILLRYGLNTFWSSSISPSKLLYLKLNLTTFFHIFLQNYFLNVLKIHYSFNIIDIYVYYFKEDKFSFLYKFLNLKKKKLTFLISRKLYGFNILKKEKLLKSNFILLFSLLILLNKIFISKLYFILLKKQIAYINSNFLFFNSFFFSKKKKIIQLKKMNLKKKNKNRLFFPKIKINLINYIIKFKWLNLFSSLLINIYINKNYIVTYKALTEKSITYLKFPFHFKYLKNYSLKQKFYIVLLGFIFLKASIINDYINIIIKKTKNKKHVKNLVMFLKYIKILFDNKFIPLEGIKFKIAGRLGGKLRKGSFHFKLGFVKLMSFKVVLDYNCKVVYTQYGSFSLKLWLCTKDVFN